MPDKEEHRSPEEIRQRMQAVIKRAQQTPSNQHADVGKGAKGGKGHKTAAPKARNFRHQGR